MTTDKSGKKRRRSIWALFYDRRRTRLVGGFQLRFLLTQIVGLVVSLALLIALLFVPAMVDVFGEDVGSGLEAANQFLVLHATAWPFVAITLVLVSYVMVLNTHRLAGPIYRFRRVFADVERGVLTMRVSTRQHDYLATEAHELDRMVASLRERIGSAQAELARVRDEVTQLAHGDEPGSASRFTELSEAVARAQVTLGQFHTDRDASNTLGREKSLASEAEFSQDVPSATPLRPRGFTLIELLLVLAMIGIIAALAMPAYSRALEAARVTRAIGDIRAIGRESQVNLLLKGCLPSALADIGMDILRDPWGRPYEYAVIAKPGKGGPPLCTACAGACIGIAQARKDKNLVPLNSDFDVYSVGPDGVSAAPLAPPASHDDVVRANDGGYFGLGRDY